LTVAEAASRIANDCSANDCRTGGRRQPEWEGRSTAGSPALGRDVALADQLPQGGEAVGTARGEAVGTARGEAVGTARGTIEVADVVKRFEGGVLAIDHVSFEAKPGEFVSIVGPSGCGKSTLLRLIAGLIPLTGGAISVHGRQVLEPRQDVALMFQRPTLLPWRTALENALLPPKLSGRLDGDAERQAYELLELVGLAGFEHTYPRHLSGGMQQRVALARLLMVGVDVLLLDEPFAAVDQLTRERLNLELLRVHERMEATALLVTHNITEAILLADRVIVMTPRPGKIADVIEVPFERPRVQEMVAEPRFQELVLRAYRGLQGTGLEDIGDPRAGVHAE
jgi:NitT/TauT family transport system ATP-binding protein